MKAPLKSTSITPVSRHPGLETDVISVLKEHEPALRKLVTSKLRGSGESAIDDVLQEVVISAQRNQAMSTIEPSKIKSWLKQIAVHKVQDYWRAVARQRKLHDKLSNLLDSNGMDLISPFEWVAQAEESQGVSDALQLLSKEDRQILELKYFKDLNYEETAQELGLTIKTLEYRLSRARKSLRRLLSRRINETGD